MLNPGQLEKSDNLEKEIYVAADVAVNEDGFLTAVDRVPIIEANFVYISQQTEKRITWTQLQAHFSHDWCFLKLGVWLRRKVNTPTYSKQNYSKT